MNDRQNHLAQRDTSQAKIGPLILNKLFETFIDKGRVHLNPFPQRDKVIDKKRFLGITRKQL